MVDFLSNARALLLGIFDIIIDALSCAWCQCLLGLIVCAYVVYIFRRLIQ